MNPNILWANQFFNLLIALIVLASLFKWYDQPTYIMETNGLFDWVLKFTIVQIKDTRITNEGILRQENLNIVDSKDPFCRKIIQYEVICKYKLNSLRFSKDVISETNVIILDVTTVLALKNAIKII